jgi:hypothetical protein
LPSPRPLKINRELRRNRPLDAILNADTRANSEASSKIPYATEQGIFAKEQGMLVQEQGIFLVKTEIISGWGFRYTQLMEFSIEDVSAPVVSMARDIPVPNPVPVYALITCTVWSWRARPSGRAFYRRKEVMFAWFVPPIVVPAVLVTLIFALALYQLFGAAWNPSELRC